MEGEKKTKMKFLFRSMLKTVFNTDSVGSDSWLIEQNFPLTTL